MNLFCSIILHWELNLCINYQEAEYGQHLLDWLIIINFNLEWHLKQFLIVKEKNLWIKLKNILLHNLCNLILIKCVWLQLFLKVQNKK
jgi:hypothetical protein